MEGGTNNAQMISLFTDEAVFVFLVVGERGFLSRRSPFLVSFFSSFIHLFINYYLFIIDLFYF